MPVTPFHMGAGMAVKALAPHHFSVLMFGLAQVAIDIEPMLGILLGWDVLHGWTHTYLGAAVIGALVLAVGRPACLPVLRWWNAELRRNRLDWLASSDSLHWLPAASGAFVGTFSHVALDSFMHADMHPFAPFSGANALLETISLTSLYVGCVAAGVAGLLLWIGRQKYATREGAKRRNRFE